MERDMEKQSYLIHKKQLNLINEVLNANLPSSPIMTYAIYILYKMWCKSETNTTWRCLIMKAPKVMLND